MRTTNNIGGDGQEKTSVKVHHAPGGQSSLCLGDVFLFLFRDQPIQSNRSRTTIPSTITSHSSLLEVRPKLLRKRKTALKSTSRPEEQAQWTLAKIKHLNSKLKLQSRSTILQEAEAKSSLDEHN